MKLKDVIVEFLWLKWLEILPYLIVCLVILLSILIAFKVYPFLIWLNENSIARIIIIIIGIVSGCLAISLMVCHTIDWLKSNWRLAKYNVGKRTWDTINDEN